MEMMGCILKCVLLYAVLHLTECLHIESGNQVLWVKQSMPFVLSCTSENIDASWFKGDIRVTNRDGIAINTNINITADREQHWTRLIFDKASDSDSGNYSCKDRHGQKDIVVKIIQGQLSALPSGKIMTFAGNPIIMTCEFEGNIKTDVTWTKANNDQLTFYGFASSRRTFSRQRVKTTLQLSKESLALTDAGSYSCKAGPFTQKLELDVLPDDACKNNLFSDHNFTPYNQISASSSYKDILYDDSAYCSPLSSSLPQCGGWSPIRSVNKPWIQVNFTKSTVIRAIIIAGRLSNDSRQEWVKSFRLSYSLDGTNWNKYKDSTERIQEFVGNSDRSTEVTVILPIPIVGRLLRIYPTSWHNKISLRFDIKGCVLPSRLKIEGEHNGKLNIHVPDILKLSCKYSGPDNPNIVWYKDGVRLLDSSGYIQIRNTTYLTDRVEAIYILTKYQTAYEDSGRYLCEDLTSGLKQSVTVYVAQLKMKPDYERLWVLTETQLQISCEYTGIDSKHIFWRRNGESAQSLGFHVTTKITNNGISTTTISTITRERATMDDLSNLTCSDGDLVRQIEVIVISGKGEPSIVIPGKPLTLKCRFDDVGSKYQFQVYWTKNYIPLHMISTMATKYEFKDNTRHLTIYHSEIGDAGHYECNVLLETGTNHQQHLTIPMEVYAPPKIMIEGQDRIKIGDTLHLYCKAEGYPLPQIDWYKGENKLKEGTSRVNFLPYSDLPNGHIVLFNVRLDDHGTYGCRASSETFGSVNSSLYVKVKDDHSSGNLLLITISVSGFLIMVIIISCLACLRCRTKQKEPIRPRLPVHHEPLLTKRYVDMHVITRRKSMSSLEEIDRLPPPPPPIDQWEDNSTLTDTSLTYERIPKRRERNST